MPHKIDVQCYAGCEIDEIMGAIDCETKDLYPPKPKNGMDIVAEYDYVNEEGELLYQVVRLKPKSFRQRVPKKDGGWLWKLNGVRRVLYRLPEVEAAIERGEPVYVVEGEKDADNLAKTGVCATTNAGGASKWDADFTATLQRANKVIIIPDNDDAGRKHARYIANKIGRTAHIVELDGVPDKGDVTDWLEGGGTPDRLLVEEPETEYPYIPLGYNDGTYYFYSHSEAQVVELAAGALSQRISFLRLADTFHWEMLYPDSKGNTDWLLAANSVMKECRKAGIFKPDKIRGRGAWIDNTRVVLHQGGHLVVNGEPHPLILEGSKYVYPRASDMTIPHNNPLTKDESKLLTELCDAMSWESPSHGKLLAGWIMCAPICGALQWRPHIWITGASGSGKSWIMDEIVRPLLGDVALSVQSATTEAGIRQTLGRDAKPVVFDEAETDSNKARGNIERVLELARQASSTSAGIVKGSAGGKSVHYHIRSMFMLSSIGLGLSRRADESRTTVCSLGKPISDEEFKAIEDKAQGITEEYASRLIARSCAMAHTIRENADTFARVLAKQLGGKRHGDQVGALMAGYWALKSDDVVSVEEAEQICVGLEAGIEEESTDESQCLMYILQTQLRVDIPGMGSDTRSVGELLQERMPWADDTLARYGIKPEGTGYVVISTSHRGIKDMLAGTPWANKWGGYLKRCEGAEALKKVVYFCGGSTTRAIKIPLPRVIPDRGADDDGDIMF